MSIASNDAFEEFKVTPYYHDTTGLLTDSGPAVLPLSVTDELIPRLDRVIQLLETQLDCPRQSPGDGHEASNAVAPHKQKNRKSIRNEARAAKRRNKNTKAKARAKFF